MKKYLTYLFYGLSLTQAPSIVFSQTGCEGPDVCGNCSYLRIFGGTTYYYTNQCITDTLILYARVYIPNQLRDAFCNGLMNSYLWEDHSSCLPAAFGGTAPNPGECDNDHALWFGGMPRRYAITHPIYTTYCNIRFWLRMGSDPSPPFEDSDIPSPPDASSGEDVFLQYQYHNELEWITLAQFSGNDYNDWTPICITFPFTSLQRVRLRWYQPEHSIVNGQPGDAWAIDNIVIDGGLTGYAYQSTNGTITWHAPDDAIIGIGDTLILPLSDNPYPYVTAKSTYCPNAFYHMTINYDYPPSFPPGWSSLSVDYYNNCQGNVAQHLLQANDLTLPEGVNIGWFNSTGQKICSAATCTISNNAVGMYYFKAYNECFEKVDSIFVSATSPTVTVNTESVFNNNTVYVCLENNNQLHIQTNLLPECSIRWEWRREFHTDAGIWIPIGSGESDLYIQNVRSLVTPFHNHQFAKLRIRMRYECPCDTPKLAEYVVWILPPFYPERFRLELDLDTLCTNTSVNYTIGNHQYRFFYNNTQTEYRLYNILPDYWVVESPDGNLHNIPNGPFPFYRFDLNLEALSSGVLQEGTYRIRAHFNWNPCRFETDWYDFVVTECSSGGGGSPGGGPSGGGPPGGGPPGGGPPGGGGGGVTNPQCCGFYDTVNVVVKAIHDTVCDCEHKIGVRIMNPCVRLARLLVFDGNNVPATMFPYGNIYDMAMPEFHYTTFHSVTAGGIPIAFVPMSNDSYVDTPAVYMFSLNHVCPKNGLKIVPMVWFPCNGMYAYGDTIRIYPIENAFTVSAECLGNHVELRQNNHHLSVVQWYEKANDDPETWNPIPQSQNMHVLTYPWQSSSIIKTFRVEIIDFTGHCSETKDIVVDCRTQALYVDNINVCVGNPINPGYSGSTAYGVCAGSVFQSWESTADTINGPYLPFESGTFFQSETLFYVRPVLNPPCSSSSNWGVVRVHEYPNAFSFTAGYIYSDADTHCVGEPVTIRHVGYPTDGIIQRQWRVRFGQLPFVAYNDGNNDDELNLVLPNDFNSITVELRFEYSIEFYNGCSLQTSTSLAPVTVHIHPRVQIPPLEVEQSGICYGSDVVFRIGETNASPLRWRWCYGADCENFSNVYDCTSIPCDLTLTNLNGVVKAYCELYISHFCPIAGTNVAETFLDLSDVEIFVDPSSGWGCPGEWVTVNVGNAVSAVWEPSYGLILSSDGLEARFAPLSTVAFTVYAVKPSGCPDTATVAFDVYEPLILPQDLTLTRCSAQPAEFQLPSGPSYDVTPAVGWHWHAQIPDRLVFDGIVADEYRIVGTSNTGCRDTTRLYFVDDATVELSLQYPSVGCGGPITLLAWGTNEVQWEGYGPGGTLTVEPGPGVHVYVARGRNGPGCPWLSATATVHVLPPNFVSVLPATPFACAGQTTTLTATGAEHYLWLPAGIAGDEYVAAPGETISLVGYWAQCTDTLDIVVEGDATSLPEIEAQTVCNGQTAFLRVVNPDPNVLYRWEPWGETGNEIVVAATQTLVATLVYENSACRYNSTFTFDVFPTPDLSVTAIPTCFNRHLTLELTGSEMQIFMTDGLGWNENFSLNGTSIVVYRPETPGEYVLTIESINAYDCGDTSTITFVTDARLPTLQITLPDSWCESTPPIPVFSPSGGTLYVDGTVRSDLAGLTPGNHTIYYVVQSDECVLDTALNIVVLPMPMEPVITGPTEICHGEKAALYSNVPVLWYRNHIEIGGPSMEISVDKEGKYKAVVINECGQTQKIWEVSLSQPKTVSYQGPEIQPCVNESAVWRASGADRYRWILPDGEMLDGSEVSFRLESPGIVTLIGFNGACSDTTFVPVNPRQPETLSIKTVCDSVVTGGSVWMSLEKDYENVFWTNESGDTISMGRELIVTPLATSDFFVHGECALGRIRIVVDDGWYVPNIFTPNRDGVNDVFFVRSVRPKDFHLIVFDRWGTIMFETKSYSHGWDGHFNGKDAAEGVYFYLLKATYCGSATTSVKGQFTLTR